MSLSILLVLSILFAAVVLFISGKFRPDLIALLVVVALLLCRILSIADALSGFSNPAVIAIAAIFVVTAGLTNTGIAALFGSYLFRAAGKSETKLIALTMGASAVLSLVMNNIAAAAVLLPGLNSVARRSNVSPSKLMMPLSFGTLLGGMATLFTTVNLLANDALHKNGLIPFGFWDFFRIGGILLVAGMLFMIAVGRKLLPNIPAKERVRINRFSGDLVELYDLPDLIFEAAIAPGSPLDKKTVAESRLGSEFNLNVIGIIRGRKLKLAPVADDLLLAGDRLLIEGDRKLFHEAKEQVGLEIESNRSARELRLSDHAVGIVEVLISPHAGIVGRSLREIRFRQKFGVAVLAVLRDGVPILRGVPDTPLHFGDTLLVQGPRPRIKLLTKNMILSFSRIQATWERSAGLIKRRWRWQQSASCFCLPDSVFCP